MFCQGTPDLDSPYNKTSISLLPRLQRYQYGKCFSLLSSVSYGTNFFQSPKNVMFSLIRMYSKQQWPTPTMTSLPIWLVLVVYYIWILKLFTEYNYKSSASARSLIPWHWDIFFIDQQSLDITCRVACRMKLGQAVDCWLMISFLSWMRIGRAVDFQFGFLTWILLG